MKYTTIDTITRSMLIQKRLPLHYYLEFSKYALDCLRELTFDSLQVINTVSLTPNSYFAVDLPCDYVDWTKVGIRQGQFVMPITQRDSIDNLRNVDSNGQYVTWGAPASQNTLEFPFWPGFWMFQNIDDLGENIGRFYGWNSADMTNGFKVEASRNQIQLSETFNGVELVLEYISNGLTADNATQVDSYAQGCIEAYQRWRFSRNSDIDRSPEGMAFVNQRRLLRARKDSLTPWDIRQILYKNYRASPKN